MTYAQVYGNGKERLAKAGIESPAFEAMCLLEAAFGLNRQLLAVRGGENAPNGEIVRFNDMVRQRCDRRPLQYILGEWPFLDLTLEMGEGVLIAREDTEVLVRTADEYLRGKSKPRVLDLCAGTGAVGLSIAAAVPAARVTCVEHYDAALHYLRRNIARNGCGDSVAVVQADVLAPPDASLFGPADVIVSNPPYVASGEIDTLQEEVRREPREALDGGPDGLDFYRAIAANWLQLLLPGGLLAVEVGEGQARAVAGLFAQAGLRNIRFAQDFSGIDRVVFGTAEQ